MAKPQLLLLLAALLAFASAADSADPPRPSVLTPISKTPLPADEEGPVEDDEAAGVGSPLPAHMTGTEGESAPEGKSETAASAASASFGDAISVGAVAAVAGYFVF